MLLIMVAGVLVAVAEFLAMAFVVNKPNIVGFQNALISAGGVLVVVVVVLWAAAALLRPKELVSMVEETVSSDSAESGGS